MAAPVAQAAPAANGTDQPAEKQQAAPTQFKVTLSKFDPAKKAKVIKEIKQILPGANLVEVTVSKLRLKSLSREHQKSSRKMCQRTKQKR